MFNSYTITIVTTIRPDSGSYPVPAGYPVTSRIQPDTGLEPDIRYTPRLNYHPFISYNTRDMVENWKFLITKKVPMTS